MADRFFEVLHLFLRNATVVLRWNVRVDRTSGPDCDLPLPFLLPMPSGSRRPTRRTGLQLALPRLLHAHAPGPSGAFVTKGRNRFSELRHIQLGADMLRRPFRPMQTRTPAKKAESTEESRGFHLAKTSAPGQTRLVPPIRRAA